MRLSKVARERVFWRCLGPEASAVMKGRLTSACMTLESSILAFSETSLRRWRAILSFARSIPVSFLNSLIR